VIAPRRARGSRPPVAFSGKCCMIGLLRLGYPMS